MSSRFFSNFSEVGDNRVLLKLSAVIVKLFSSLIDRMNCHISSVPLYMLVLPSNKAHMKLKIVNFRSFSFSNYFQSESRWINCQRYQF